MKLQRKRKQMPILVPIASMGDIAFLLIIFFMVTSNFMRERIPLEEARSSDIEKQKEIMVSVVVDVHGNVFLQGQSCPTEALSDGVQVALGESEDRRVKLKVDRRAEERHFRPVLAALSDAGTEIVLVGQLKAAQPRGNGS